ncbi:hypothetical protein [Polaromonas jejuensis]|uniref:Lipoprotein n=1 Tax=Polaromonas jejuensis TaxID=457502 RepID=A0ABW0QFW7_9BURK|nr:hypothetical protein [Polaromonas jejuensis]
MHKMSRLCAGLMLAGVLAACIGPPDDSRAEDVQLQLMGTWLRDYEENGIRVRRVLVLAQDGHFSEMTKATQYDVIVARHDHAGEWHFDGTNLKRRYTLIDGNQPSAPMFPYVAFELRFESRNEFIGTDNVRQRQVRYQRVADGTLP